MVAYDTSRIRVLIRPYAIRWCKNIAENFNPLGRAQQRHRRTGIKNSRFSADMSP